MASLGSCPGSGNLDAEKPFIFMNEVTTVAAVYEMADMASDATHISGTPNQRASSGVMNAADLVSITTGFANESLPARPDRNVPRSKIHTLANILAACVDSASSVSAACTALLTHARSEGESGTMPVDTATAAINIARHPHANVGALFGLQSKVSAPFSPALESAPADFTISTSPADAETTVAFTDVRQKE
jgi:hypothetical protein